MKIEYKKELNASYIVIKTDRKRAEHYTFRMLEENNIEGLLKVDILLADSTAALRYDITSKNSLERILEQGNLSAEDIRKIILKLISTVEGLGNYLLNESGIILTPEYIYSGSDDLDLLLMYYPGFEGDFLKQLSKLLRKMLGSIDHNNHEAVVMAYGLYKESLKDNYVIDDLISVISKKYEYKSESLGDTSDKKQYQDTIYIEESSKQEEKDLGKVKKSFLGGLFKKHAKKQNHSIDIEDEKLEKTQEDEWRTLFEQQANVSTSIVKADNKIEEGHEIEEGNKLEAGHKIGAGHKLVCMNSDIGDTDINYYPFFIGSQDHVADLVINAETVSRMHAKIDMAADGKLNIVDLSSTYGTEVNGNILNDEEVVTIVAGDIIRTGEISFTLK